MRNGHDTPTAPLSRRAVAPILAAIAVAAFASGCRTPLREIGKAPEGDVREIQSRADRARAEEARHARQDAADAASEAPAAAAPAAAKGKVEATSAAALRTGTAASKRFHLAGCPDLDAAPTGERILFVSYWEAVDSGYAPCPRCKPGP